MTPPLRGFVHGAILLCWAAIALPIVAGAPGAAAVKAPGKPAPKAQSPAPGPAAKQARKARKPAGGQAAAPSPGTPATLRAAIEDLTATFAGRYPRGKEFLAHLAALEARMAAAAGDDDRDELQEGRSAQRTLQEFLKLQREALLANPLVREQPILFVVRRQYRSDHHNTATMFQTGEINTGSFQGGGALKAIDFSRGADPEVRTLLTVPNGVARDPDVSFDGRKVLVSMRRDVKDDYHLYELDLDAPPAGSEGGALKQLTFGAELSDIDPMYLPDGRIVFTSTREPKYCMCNRHIMGNLFRMDADGANIQQIGHSTLHEGHASLTGDGRVLYDRWEYVDRNFGDAQGLWVCNPDGTNHALYWGNNTPSPGAVLDARDIPAQERYVANFSSCHDRPWGAIALVDRSRGVDGKDPVIRTWPPGAIDLVMKGNYDTFTRTHPKYEDPYPLAEAGSLTGAGKYFLCSRQVAGDQAGGPLGMGVFLLDVFGNEILLHAEAPGCFDPMPLGPRHRPPVVPDRIDLSRREGRFYVCDVYVGTGWERVPRGTIKRLRVVESPEKRSWTQSAWDGGTGQQAPGMAWDDFNNKRILGTVPVEADGSAYFSVPADTFVYFQLLDADGMMVQSMRSGTIVRPGETTGCVGCHDRRLDSVPSRSRQAFGRPPRELTDWYGPARLFSYRLEVQPVFDKYCVRCHDIPGGQSASAKDAPAKAGKAAPAAKDRTGASKLILAGDQSLCFNFSYAELRRKGYVNVPGAGPAQVLPPYSWGSHASKLTGTLRRYLAEGKLDRESFDRVVTWIDINAPYYPTYASAYVDNLFGRCPLDNKQLKELSALTGVDVTNRGSTPRVSFTRPELSSVLARFQDTSDPEGTFGPKYKRALEIIRAGQAMLAQRPRADMAGFRVDGIEARREARYEQRLRLEAEMRQAIVDGRKAYTPDDPRAANAGGQ